jgi:hypothetical protein
VDRTAGVAAVRLDTSDTSCEILVLSIVPVPVRLTSVIRVEPVGAVLVVVTLTVVVVVAAVAVVDRAVVDVDVSVSVVAVSVPVAVSDSPDDEHPVEMTARSTIPGIAYTNVRLVRSHMSHHFLACSP